MTQTTLGKIEFKILHHLIENDFLGPVPKVNTTQLIKGRAYIKGINKSGKELQPFIQSLKKKGVIKEYKKNNKTYYTYTLKGLNEFYKRDVNEKDYKAVAYKIITYIKRNSKKIKLPILNSYLGEISHMGVEGFYYTATQKELYEDFISFSEMW